MQSIGKELLNQNSSTNRFFLGILSKKQLPKTVNNSHPYERTRGESALSNGCHRKASLSCRRRHICNRCIPFSSPALPAANLTARYFIFFSRHIPVNKLIFKAKTRAKSRYFFFYEIAKIDYDFYHFPKIAKLREDIFKTGLPNLVCKIDFAHFLCVARLSCTYTKTIIRWIKSFKFVLF